MRDPVLVLMYVEREILPLFALRRRVPTETNMDPQHLLENKGPRTSDTKKVYKNGSNKSYKKSPFTVRKHWLQCGRKKAPLSGDSKTPFDGSDLNKNHMTTKTPF